MDWKKTLAAVAPALATAIGGPLAGMAVKIATDSLGIEPTENALAEIVLSGNPEALLKLKEADNLFKIELKRLDIELEKLVVDDRKDARKLASVDMRPQVFLSALFIIGYFLLVYFQALGEITVDPMTFGIITVSIPMIMQFWFGSSHGSKQKTNSMIDDG